jgi:glycosyltransferase involved in cell wall biosynthesis
MVVRNESFFIATAIESAQPVVDEIVVVDTGSTDDTPDIARRLGARVVLAEWPGDLGRAHDLPLSHARGDWVLSLDGDEVLDPATRHLVHDLAASGRCDGFILPVRNYSYDWINKWRPSDPRDPLTFGAPGYVDTAPVRLFRRRPQHTYSGRLHQTMRHAILSNGGLLDVAPVPIHHYGFLRSDRAKSALYATLARQQTLDAPDDPRSWIEFGIALGEAEAAAAADAFRRARTLGERPTASFLLATALIDLGRPAEAIPLLRQAIRGNSRDALPGFDRADGWMSMGTAFEDLARPHEAEGAYREAIRTRPDSPAAMINLAALLAEQDRTGEAEALVNRLLERYRGFAIVWNTLGVIRLRQGDPNGARVALETALDIDPRSVAALTNVGIAYARLGRPRKAARAVASARTQIAGDAAAVRRIVARTRSPRLARGRAGSTVVHLIDVLVGGAGRVLVDGVHALRDWRHVVICRCACTHGGQGLDAELRRAGVPVIVAHSPDAMHDALSRIGPVAVLHHWAVRSVWASIERTNTARWVCIGHDACAMPAGYDAYIVLSQFGARHQTHLPRDRVHRIPNRVDPRAFAKGRRASSQVTIAMLSRLDPGRFPRRLLDYIEPFADLHPSVLIAGCGPRRHEIEPELPGRGLARIVRFVGPVKSTRVPEFLGAADIGLHLTETHQVVCPVAILEMMAAGLPIVAEPKGALVEMVVPGKTGYLENGEGAIGSRLRELILSPKLRRRMGAASRRAAAHFDVARYERAMRKLVRRLTA